MSSALRSHEAEENRKPILVTGMHRSGTTWLGKVLCASGELIDVGEPLNVRNRMTVLRSRVPIWYAYITEGNEDDYLPYYRDAASFRPHPLQDLRRTRGGLLRDPSRIPRRWASFLLGRFQRRRLLIKDPFAVFSAPWFSQRLGCDVVISVRHPAAVVSSLKSHGWRFDFADLLRQPDLMTERLSRFESEMEAALETPEDVIGQGSLLWRMIYDAVHRFRATGHPIQVVRHEDLARHPEPAFRSLYEQVRLTFSERARREVHSADLADWRPRLTAEEVVRIRTLTGDVWPRYYSDEDWRSAGLKSME